MASRINHISSNAPGLQESVASYVDLLATEPITKPNPDLPVQELARGRARLLVPE